MYKRQPNELVEQDVISLSEERSETAAIRDRRLAAYKAFQDMAWPDSSKDEFWRSTPFKRVETGLGLVAGSDAEAPAVSLADDAEAALATAVIVDGALVSTTVPTELAEQGVVVTSLADADHADLVGERLTTLTTAREDTGYDEFDRTVALNDAAWTAGVLVHVPANVELSAPVLVRIHVTEAGTHLPRVLVDMGHHARATVVLEHTSTDPGDERVLVDEVVEAFCADASALKLVSFQDWTGGVDHLALHKGRVERNARFDPVELNFGGRTVRMRPEADLVAPGGETYPAGCLLYTSPSPRD